MVETQFNWIFALVIGAIILVMVIGFINSQREKSEQMIGLTIAKDLNTIITQTSVSKDQAEVITIPNKKIEFSCDPESCNTQGCTSGFKIAKSGVGWETPVHVIFSPDVIEGTSLISWSLDWNMPYHATNFIYLTSKDVRYIFVGDSNLIKKLYADFPSVANKELTNTVNTLTNMNNYKVKLIYYEGISPIPSGFVNMPSGSVTAIKIASGEDEEEIGEVSFYRNVRGNPSFTKHADYKYLGLPGLYGAIFAEDVSMYECNMNKAMIRLYLASLVYDKSASNYLNSSDVKSSCKNFYDKDAIASIGGSARTMNFDLEAENIYESAEELRADNHNLKIYSCPLLY